MSFLDYDILPGAQAVAGGPVCVVLHGLGDSKLGWRPVASMLNLPSLTWVFVNAPWPYHDGWSWYDIYEDRTYNHAQIRDSHERLVALLAHLRAKLAVPSARMALLGFSQGCAMTINLALRSDERFGAVVGISGYVPLIDDFPADFGTAAKQQPLLWTHGLHDPLIPINHVRQQREDLAHLGINADWREYHKDHSVDPSHELPAIAAFLRTHLG